MERRKTLLCTLLLSGALLAGCGDDEAEQESSTATDMTTDTQPATADSREGGEGQVAEPSGEGGTAADVSTGQAGTTSEVTGSDMNVEDETMGDGQSQEDQMSLSGQEDQSSQSSDTTQPERQSSGGTGESGSGQPQASSQKNTEENSQ